MSISEAPDPRLVRKDLHGAEPCDGCNGTGHYFGHGHVLNGVFKGFVGECFRCGGKGYQTERDERRNRYYDRNHRRLSA